MTTGEILIGLSSLSKKDLELVRKTATLLLAKSSVIDSKTELFYDNLTLNLQKVDVNTMNIHIYKKQKPDSYVSLIEVCDEVFSFMGKYGVLKLLEQKLFLSLLTPLVIDKILESNVPLLMNTLIAFYKNAPSYFRNAYPNYDRVAVQFLIKSRSVNEAIIHHYEE
jgi:hypothetical protein